MTLQINEFIVQHNLRVNRNIDKIEKAVLLNLIREVSDNAVIYTVEIRVQAVVLLTEHSRILINGKKNTYGTCLIVGNDGKLPRCLWFLYNTAMYSY